MNKISFTTLACPEWDIGQIVSAAVASGYDAIDFRGYLDCVELPESPAFQGKALREIASRVADAGLEVSCLSSSARLSAPSADERARSLDGVRRYADLCRVFGAKQIRVFGGPANGIADPVANAAETLVAMAGVARDAEVVVAVETHDSWTDSSQLRAVFEKAGWPEGVGFLWDVHHPYRFHGEAPEASASNMGGRLLNTHWKDSAAKADGGFELRLCGEGDVPLRSIAQTLRAVGYGGCLTFEWEKRWHPEIPGPEVAVPHFARFIREVWPD
ncbi:MAG: sugar phosphate isomerase/epimerase [Kiritimatiellae bacterium]|nr:sugar phosphate isomerase/epimerase [Kiritimatiellia bacterium]